MNEVHPGTGGGSAVTDELERLREEVEALEEILGRGLAAGPPYRSANPPVGRATALFEEARRRWAWAAHHHEQIGGPYRRAVQELRAEGLDPGELARRCARAQELAAVVEEAAPLAGRAHEAFERIEAELGPHVAREAEEAETRRRGQWPPGAEAVATPERSAGAQERGTRWSRWRRRVAHVGRGALRPFAWAAFLAGTQALGLLVWATFARSERPAAFRPLDPTGESSACVRADAVAALVDPWAPAVAQAIGTSSPVGQTSCWHPLDGTSVTEPPLSGLIVGPATRALPTVDPGRPRWYSKLRVGVHGGVTATAVQTVVRGHLWELAHCYDRSVPRASFSEGTVFMRFLIDDRGRVPAVIATPQSTLRDSALHGCVLDSIRRWTFPTPSDGRITVVGYPFHFSLD